ncbi:uncharacterized protein EV154DRAFT_389807, partial [Mucor mucedo]|uniref:uncharacterized protein n=1 Tax=Mucor mucedo TaxID=29922 RepID=UPI00221FD358
YIMDIISPKLYRLINGIAHETACKIENSTLYSLSNLKRQVQDPPADWLSNDNIVLSRVSKKQKK